MTVMLRPLAKCGKAENRPPTHVQALKMAMQRLNLVSAWALAKRLRCDTSTIKGYLSGKRTVNLAVLAADPEVEREFYRCAEMLSRVVEAA